MKPPPSAGGVVRVLLLDKPSHLVGVTRVDLVIAGYVMPMEIEHYATTKYRLLELYWGSTQHDNLCSAMLSRGSSLRGILHERYMDRRILRIATSHGLGDVPEVLTAFLSRLEDAENNQSALPSNYSAEGHCSNIPRSNVGLRTYPFKVGMR